MTTLADMLSNQGVGEHITKHLNVKNLARLKLAGKQVRDEIDDADVRGAFNNKLKLALRNDRVPDEWWKNKETLREKVEAHVAGLPSGERARIARLAHQHNMMPHEAFILAEKGVRPGLQRMVEALRATNVIGKYSIRPQDVPGFKAFVAAHDRLAANVGIQTLLMRAAYIDAGGDREAFPEYAEIFMRFVHAIEPDCVPMLSFYMHAVKDGKFRILRPTLTSFIKTCIQRVGPRFLEVQRQPGELLDNLKTRQSEAILDAWKEARGQQIAPRGRPVLRLGIREYIMYRSPQYYPPVKYLGMHPGSPGNLLHTFRRTGAAGSFFASKIPGESGRFTVVHNPFYAHAINKTVTPGTFTLYHMDGFQV